MRCGMCESEIHAKEDCSNLNVKRSALWWGHNGSVLKLLRNGTPSRAARRHQLQKGHTVVSAYFS